MAAAVSGSPSLSRILAAETSMPPRTEARAASKHAQACTKSLAALASLPRCSSCRTCHGLKRSPKRRRWEFERATGVGTLADASGGGPTSISMPAKVTLTLSSRCRWLPTAWRRLQRGAPRRGGGCTNGGRKTRRRAMRPRVERLRKAQEVLGHCVCARILALCICSQEREQLQELSGERENRNGQCTQIEKMLIDGRLRPFFACGIFMWHIFAAGAGARERASPHARPPFATGRRRAPQGMRYR